MDEEKEQSIEWFEEKCFFPKHPAFSADEEEPAPVISIDTLVQFLDLKKFHRRSYNYPDYAQVMKEVEKFGITNRTLTKEQFLRILSVWKVGPIIQHELNLAFKVFDTEGRGFLELEELEQIVTLHADKFSPEELQEFLRDANMRGNGNVYYEQFIHSMFRIAPELNQIQTEYLYSDPDEDPSVPPLPPERDPEPELPAEMDLEPPPPPAPASKGKGGKKKK